MDRRTALLGLARAFGSPFACSHESHTFHWDGQLLVLKGANDPSGGREGLWVYFDEDGRFVWDEEIEGVAYERTGAYSDGRCVRHPTDEELRDAKREADRLTAEHRRRFRAR